MDQRSRVKIPTEYILAEKSYSLAKCERFAFNPVGITVSTIAENSIKKALLKLSLEECPRAHIIIDRNGHAFQLNSLRHRTHHSQNAIWRGFYPNDHHLSVYFLNHGYAKKINSHVAVQSPTMFKYKVFPSASGLWEQFTNDQILAFVGLIDFALENGVFSHNIVGIHELQKDNFDTLGVMPFNFNFVREALMYKLWKPMILGYKNPINRPLRPE